MIVLTTTKEHAELKRDQIIAYGKDDLIKNCKGSMHATIESVEYCIGAGEVDRYAMKLRTVTLGCKVNQYETEFVREGSARHRLRGCGRGRSRPICASSTPAR